MATIWIGDFRVKQLQYYKREGYSDEIFLAEDSAEYSWLKDSALVQLPRVYTEKANIVLMIGFNDCIHSCIWKSFNISNIAESYSKLIAELKDTYTESNLYICSVMPIDAPYPFAGYGDGKVPVEVIDKKIATFNNIIKDSGAIYVDLYKYLTSTGFVTRDGIRYSQNTCEDVISFIRSNFKTQVANSFKVRTTAPKIDKENPESDPYWLGEAYGGFSPFANISEHINYGTGDTLPNCTAYAWGRFYEILGSKPTLSTSNAENWYLNTADGYERGKTPALGAVVCWQSGNIGDDINISGSDTGHVAIVEQINSDGSITISESSWNSFRWKLTKVSKNTAGDFLYDSYTFQGFIYNPAVSPGAGINTDNVTKGQVVSKDESLGEDEKKINARYIWSYLGTRGWSLNAVAGILGNMEHESSINPGRNEIGGSGFGLVQWTPKSNLTSWTQPRGYADDDIDGQLERIIWEKDNNKQYYKNHYKYTFEEFSTSTDDPYTLACAFAFDYERSAVVLWGFNSTTQRDNYIREHGEVAAAQKAEQNREALRKNRGNSAVKWAKFLAPLAPEFGKEFTVDCLKVNKATQTSIDVSFIMNNGTKGTYEVFNSKGKLVTYGNIANLQSKASDEMTTVYFSVNSLIPGADYTLVTYISSDEDGGNILTKTIPFSIPQALPKSVQKIEFSTADTLLPNENFSLKASVLHETDWGYWKNNGYGYTIQLIVNGRVKKEKEVKSLPKTFKISDYFNYNNLKVGDVVQIGIRTWVLYNNEPLYDNDFAKCSNTICMLKKHVVAYLNKD